MTTAESRAVLRDPEEIALLGDEPELLAIADAYASTQRQFERRPPLTRPNLRRVAVLAAAIGVVVLLGLVQPWHTNESFAARALNALGDGQTVHAVLVGSRPGQFVVDLATGAQRAMTTEVEEWYDAPADKLHVVQRAEGQTVSDVIDSGPDGIVNSDGGIGYTCSWIGAHPLEAQRVGVSCDAAASTGSRDAAVDPALTTVLTGYRSALKSGQARTIGRGAVRGRSVIWVSVSSPAETEEVAVDAETYLPVEIRPVDGESGHTTGMQWAVKTIETLPSAGSDFTFSQPVPPILDDENVVASSEVAPAEISSVLGQPALWLGDAVAGLPLASARLQTVDLSDGRASSRTTRLELTYGTKPQDFVTIDEAIGASNTGLLPITPPPGMMYVSDFGILSKGQLGLLHGLNTTITASNTQLLVTAARALGTAPRPSATGGR